MEDRSAMKNIKVEIEDYPKDDYMKIGRVFIMDIFENRFIKFLIIFYLIFNIMLLSIQGYIFLSTFESSIFLMYSPIYFATCFLVVSLVGTLKITPCVKECLTMMKFWKINIDGKFHRRIVTESKFINIFIVINTIWALFSAFLYMFPSNEEKLIFFAYDIFKRFSPKWENTLTWIYVLGLILNGLIMPASCSQLVYFTTHVRHQIYVILHHLENMNRNCDATTELHLPYDENYQKEIKHKLTLIGKRIHHITKTGLTIMDQARIYAVLFSITGVALGISILMIFIKIPGSFQVNYFSISIATIATFSTSVAPVIAGQKVEDMHEEIHNVLNGLNWYTWNKENKQIYLILLLSQTNPFKLDITDDISINYNLGLRIARANYSVASILKPSLSL